jgi:hypothetical protein
MLKYAFPRLSQDIIAEIQKERDKKGKASIYTAITSAPFAYDMEHQEKFEVIDQPKVCVLREISPLWSTQIRQAFDLPGLVLVSWVRDGNSNAASCSGVGPTKPLDAI